LDIWCDKMAENATWTRPVGASLEAITDTAGNAVVPTWAGQSFSCPGMSLAFERGQLHDAGFEQSAPRGKFDRSTRLPHTKTGLPADDMAADWPRESGRSNGTRHESREFDARAAGAVCETDSAEPFGRSVREAASSMANQVEHSRTVAPMKGKKC
jgi:hypothetical protein